MFPNIIDLCRQRAAIVVVSLAAGRFISLSFIKYLESRVKTATHRRRRIVRWGLIIWFQATGARYILSGDRHQPAAYKLTGWPQKQPYYYDNNFVHCQLTISWWRSIVVKTAGSAGVLSLSCARLTAGRVTTLWVKRPLSLSLPFLRGRLNE